MAAKTEQKLDNDALCSLPVSRLAEDWAVC